jgi:hypothetical protein
MWRALSSLSILPKLCSCLPRSTPPFFSPTKKTDQFSDGSSLHAIYSLKALLILEQK